MEGVICKHVWAASDAQWGEGKGCTFFLSSSYNPGGKIEMLGYDSFWLPFCYKWPKQVYEKMFKITSY